MSFLKLILLSKYKKLNLRSIDHLFLTYTYWVTSMKAVILAGGLGTRLSEETVIKPKPMVEIGDKPILWHIMKIYHAYGISEFIICCGYKGNVIKEYFSNYLLHNSNVTFNTKLLKIQSNSTKIRKR